MFKILFTVAALLLLATTPGECDSTNAAAITLAETAKEVATIEEKIKHYQSLTNVVTSLADGLGLGNTCMAHHLYMTGPAGIPNSTYKTFVKQLGTITQTASSDAPTQNWTEAVVSGLIAVAKADVYVLKQIVDTSKIVLEVVIEMEAADEAIKLTTAKTTTSAMVMVAGDTPAAVTPEASNTNKPSTVLLTDKQKDDLTTMKKSIEKTLRAHVQNAIRVLPAVEDAIFGYAVGIANKPTAHTKTGFHSDITEEENVTAAGKAVVKLAGATSDMIKGYFALLGEIKETGTGLTGMTKIKANTDAKGKTDVLAASTDNFGLMKAYQEAFVAYINKTAKTETLLTAAVETVKINTSSTAKSELSSVIGVFTPGDEVTVLTKKEGKTLATARKAYTDLELTTLTDGAAADNVVMCGRLKLSEIIPQKQAS